MNDNIAEELIKIANIMVGSNIFAEEKSYPYNKGPNTPWGRAQTVNTIERGVSVVSTPGHGGIGVADGVAKKRLSQQALALGLRQGGYYWYEEDCLCAIPLYEVESWRKALSKSSKEELEDSIRRWTPKYFEAGFGEKESKFVEWKDLKIDDVITINNRYFQIFEQGYTRNEFRVKEVGTSNTYHIKKSVYMNGVSKVTRNNEVLWEN